MCQDRGPSQTAGGGQAAGSLCGSDTLTAASAQQTPGSVHISQPPTERKTSITDQIVGGVTRACSPPNIKARVKSSVYQKHQMHLQSSKS